MIFKFTKEEKEKLLKMKNVVGVGVGMKVVKDINTGIPAVKVFVKEKIPMKELKKKDLVPLVIGENMTDVEEVGEIVAQYGETPYQRERRRPIKPGFSIGHREITAGTIGAIVFPRFKPSGIALVDRIKHFIWKVLLIFGIRMKRDYAHILSNNHVLANSRINNNIFPTDRILQPGIADEGDDPSDTVAQLRGFVPLETDSNNRVDCAKALINPEVEYDEGIEKIGYIKGIDYPFVGMIVKKFGRTSAYTEGEIKAIAVTIEVSYPEIGKKLMFENQIMTTEMSGGGDSGSLVLNTNNKAVGLLFAGSWFITLLNPIEEVLNALNVEF